MTAFDNPPGTDRESLIAAIRRGIGNDPAFTIDDGGEARLGFDVRVMWTQVSHRLVTAITCIDQALAVTDGQVASLLARPEGAAADRKIIVSASGFTPAARMAAAEHDIFLMALYDAQHFNWKRLSGFLEQHRHIGSIRVEFGLKPPRDGRPLPGNFIAYDESGRPFDDESYTKAAHAAFENDPNLSGKDGKDLRAVLLDKAPGRFVIDPTGARFEVDQIRLSVVYSITTTPKPAALP